VARKKQASAQLVLEAPVVTRTLSEEVESAFLEYSMSVIVSRALPDVRDGLKPVHRRILWAMHDSGLRPDRQFVKCARVVGDVMGRFHPHGDAAIYDALVRLGQDFSLPVPLIDKHGNFGSPADPPAAPRYTECRLSPAAMELLAGIDEGTVDLQPNYDGSDEEPVVLPSRFPNLLVNGAQGIAVGLATNIPPHNLGEIVDATLFLMEKPEASLAQLLRKVHGPDFPTGALIMGGDGIEEAYRTGRGSLRLRAVTELEESRRGAAIVVTAVPYQTSVDAIAGKLADAVETGKVGDVRDIRNESGQGKTRLVIELRAGADPDIVRNNLFKHTPAQTTFGVNMVALVDGVPRTIGLLEILRHWIDHQVIVVTRRTRFRLGKAEARLHVVEGLVKAVEMIDAIVKAIRASNDRGAARATLMSEPFGFSEIQATYILDLTLGRLTKLGRDELLQERKELLSAIRDLRKVLADRKVLMGVIRAELIAIRGALATPRRTQVVTDDMGALDVDALVADEPLVVTVTARGYVRAISTRSRGAKVAAPGPADALAQVIETTARQGLLVLTDRGRAYRAACHDLPKERLTAAQNLFHFGDGERAVAVIDARLAEEHEHLVFATALGGVKRTPFAEFAEASGRRDGIVAMKVADGDRVVAVFPGWDDYDLLMVTASGQGIRFAESEVRPVGRGAGTVRGIRLKGPDRVVGACAIASDETVVVGQSAGFLKRLRADDVPSQCRGGAGLRVCRLDRGRGDVVAIAPAVGRVTLLTTEGAVTVDVTAVKLAGRDAGGSRIEGAGLGGELVRILSAPAEAVVPVGCPD